MQLNMITETDLLKPARIPQIIPAHWGHWEALRNKGQFFTPEWIAKAMIEYVTENAQTVFYPATGDCAFYHALKTQCGHKNIHFYGID